MSKTLIAVALVLCVLVQVSVQKSDVLPQKVIDFMATRKMRYHHFLWHNLRENWFALDASTQHAIKALGWEPPRPTLLYRADGTEVLVEGNGAGEDFLYMHRQMVIEVNKMVADTDYEKIVGWKRAPYPGDPKWPVPANYNISEPVTDRMVKERKTDAYFWSAMQPADELLWDHNYLRTITLADLGNQLEFGIHRDLHLRFSSPGTFNDFRFGGSNPTPEVDTKWDNPLYMWLGDSYSSHVNPTFWKIHGWVDDHIEAWRVANGLDKIEWKWTWENGPEATIEDLFAAGDVTDGDDDVDPDADAATDSDYDHHFHTMEKAVQALLKAGVKEPFARDVRSSVYEKARNYKF